ncbi:hypothetical protein E2P81_ATG01296 [Venturia nashicola]|nr:hypothetical protein E2P81_ATG01296 [Venturia nashicola]
MKGPSSATILGLVGVASFLPHHALAIPAEHNSAASAVPAHHHNTTSTSSRDTLQQTTQKRKDENDPISIQECVSHPGWWLSCCDHKTSSNFGWGAGCLDYSDSMLDLPNIGHCEKGSSLGTDRDHGPYCFFPGPGELHQGARLDKEDRDTWTGHAIIFAYYTHSLNSTISTGVPECQNQYENDAKVCNDNAKDTSLDADTYLKCITEAVIKCKDVLAKGTA